mmetsp:Transcript_20616/g.49081  ORF Transcript_20616/g.49081 Transcript_20616/m.49081 type:complete len:446 (-) Transcript_20616:110-1447(-)
MGLMIRFTQIKAALLTAVFAQFSLHFTLSLKENKPTNSTFLYDVCPGDDFDPFRKGISYGQLQTALSRGGWKLKILNGKLYVDIKRFSSQDGLPAKRDFFNILGAYYLTERYKNKLPDVEFVFHTHDQPKIPVVNKKQGSWQTKAMRKGKLVWSVKSGPPPFMFSSYVSRGQKTAWDASWPQFTIWGEMLDKRPSDPPWEVLRKELMDSWIPWEKRNSSLFWSGSIRTNPVRGAATKCRGDGYLIGKPDMPFYGAQKCVFKYLLYVDGRYSSSSALPIIGCGSVPLMVSSQWTTSWSRCLKPWVHYVPIINSPKGFCNDLDKKMRWLRENPEKAASIARNVQEFVRDKLSMDSIYDFMFRRLLRLRELSRWRPHSNPTSDVHISSYEALVSLLRSVMKRSGNKPEHIDGQVNGFVAFNKGDRCCANCRANPFFAHLCGPKSDSLS